MCVSMFRGASAALVMVVALAAAALAEAPSVQFDLDPLVAVRDVTTFEFSEVNPQERLVEARIVVSALLRRGAVSDLAEYQFTFSSPERNFSIADYAPKTALATDVAGTIHTEKNEQKAQSEGLNLSLKYDHLSAGGASLGNEEKQGNTVKFDRLPPLELVSAAGTFDRGRGLYIKLKPSPRTSLEGTHEFQVTLRVPKTWRGDYLQVRCVALGIKRGSMKQLDERITAGNSTFLLALYEQPDFTARAAAERLLNAEQALRELAVSRRKDIEKAAYANNQAKKLAIFLDLSEPRVPENWLGQVLYGSVGNDAPSYTSHLPSDVVAHVSQFTSAKLELHRLSGR